MKVVVMNFSGNVGKSTIARHLLAPRLGAVIVPIETINSDGTDDVALRGKQFAELLETMAVTENVVVDVGASNVEDFLTQMTKYNGSHEDFDLFVVPTVSNIKQQRDTNSTVEYLLDMGVAAHKIKIVFNMLEADEEPTQLFSGMFADRLKSKGVVANPSAAIHSNELFAKLRGSEMTIQRVLSDTTDFKALMQSTTDREQKLAFSQSLAIKRLAVGVNLELDSVFDALVH